jgi:hypothetical protein
MSNYPPLHLAPLTSNSFQAWQEGSDRVFVVRKTTEGWKTDGHPAFDGLLCATKEELVAYLEGTN